MSVAEVRGMLHVALTRSTETQALISQLNEDLGQVRMMTAQVTEKIQAIPNTPLADLANHVVETNAVLVNLSTIEVQGMAATAGKTIDTCEYAVNAAMAALDESSAGHAAVVEYNSAKGALEGANGLLIAAAAEHTEVPGSSPVAAEERMHTADNELYLMQAELENAYTALLRGDQLIKTYMATL